MRTTLLALLAFLTGIALTLHAPQQLLSPAHASQPAASSAAAASAPHALPSSDFERGQRWPINGPTPEQVLYAQAQMVRDALAALTPRVPATPNLYLLTFAGDGSQDVFRNEAEYAARLFTERFGASTHVLVLENNPATVATHPLASWSNLEAALAGLQQVMDPDQDILLLYLTSHGSEDHTLLVDMAPLPLDFIDAENLAGILAANPFKWKVVVVNACYSGGFIPPLHGPGTMVLTAARSDRSSFGCGVDSDLTYFGRAWLVDALNRTDNFVDAFQLASAEINQWEKQDQLTPSEPQIAIGRGITDQLARWRTGVTPGPALPFKPVAPASASIAPQR